jgi:hypothetical protein
VTWQQTPISSDIRSLGENKVYVRNVNLTVNASFRSKLKISTCELQCVRNARMGAKLDSLDCSWLLAIKWSCLKLKDACNETCAKYRLEAIGNVRSSRESISYLLETSHVARIRKSHKRAQVAYETGIRVSVVEEWKGKAVIKAKRFEVAFEVGYSSTRANWLKMGLPNLDVAELKERHSEGLFRGFNLWVFGLGRQNISAMWLITARGYYWSPNTTKSCNFYWIIRNYSRRVVDLLARWNCKMTSLTCDIYQ